jgi:catechol 2,3-dioxygenase-like lactoylglutathione lyase family enzyme
MLGARLPSTAGCSTWPWRGRRTFARSEVPYFVLRVNEAATLDLIAVAADETPPSIHLALAVRRPAFEEVQRRLDGLGIPWRGSVVRGERPGEVGRTHGSRGRAPSLYFEDEDGHSIEIRSYDDGGPEPARGRKRPEAPEAAMI